MGHRTAPFSARLPRNLAEDLARYAGSLGVSTSAAAIRLLEEGIRMSRFPGIDFRAAATGRAAFVTGTGLSVWELFSVWQDHGRSVAKVRKNYPHLTVAQVAAAARYAQAYRAEIEAESARGQPPDPLGHYPTLARVRG